MQFKTMKLKDLKNLVLACHDSINIVECYGTKDLINLENGIVELKRRGYQVDFDNRISIYESNPIHKN